MPRVMSDTLARDLRYREHDERWTPPMPHPNGKVMRPAPNHGRLVQCGFEDRATGENRSKFDRSGFSHE